MTDEKMKPVQPAKDKDAPKAMKKAAPAPPPLKTEEQREHAYEQACKMEQWVQWAASFQDKAELYEQAAEAFRALGEYKDSPQRMQECMDGANHAATVEQDEAFREVKALVERAKSSSDYYYAEEKLERFSQLPEAQELIAHCKSRRSKHHRMKQIAGIAVAAVLCFCLAVGMYLWKTTALQYRIGNFYMEREDYTNALTWYLRSKNYADSQDRITVCRYERGKAFLEQGKYQQAYQKFREVKDYLDGEQLAEKCFVAELAQAGPGKVVKFGQNDKELAKWIVLANDGKEVTLIAEFHKNHAFDREGKGWAESELRVWLNTELADKMFKSYELERLSGPVAEAEEGSTGLTDGMRTSDPIYILSAAEAEQYADVLTGLNEKGKPIDKYEAPGHGWWLRTPGAGEGGQAVFQKDGTVDYYGRDRMSELPKVRPVVTVDITN